MLSRVLRVLFVAWFALVAVFLHAAVTDGWTLGVSLGLLALVLGHPTVLALEFALARRQNVRASGTAVPLATLLSAWMREWRESALVFGWRLPWRTRAVPDHLPASARGRRGVVLVHGFLCNRAIWNPWLARLRALDRAFVAVSLEPVFGEIDGYAAAFEDAIARVEAATGLPPLIVAHSMGGLVARAWLRTGDPSAMRARVAHVVTLGTPHGGTWLAGLALSPNARQMRVGSEWMTGLGGFEPIDRGALFTCWWSDCDQIVFPGAMAVLPGSESRRLQGVAHVSLCRREEIWDDVVVRLKP